MIGIILVIVFAISYWLMKQHKGSKLAADIKAAGYKEVPMVKGCYPIVGHGIAFGKDVIGFMRKAYEENGKIFKLKIFLKEVIVVCDRNLVRKFFKKPENEMSLYSALESLFFGDAFSDESDFVTVLSTVVRRAISMNYDTFVPKIVEEAERMTKRMRDHAGTKSVSILEECMRFVSRTSAKCFVDIDLDDKFYDRLISFNHLFSKVIVLTYFFPYWLLCKTAKPLLAMYRRKMTKILMPQIREYREDPEKKDSLVIRIAVDYRDKETGQGLTDDYIGNIIVALLYIASENTALGMCCALIDLASDPVYWDKVKAESRKHLANNDIRSLLASSTIEAAIMESARLNSHAFGLSRAPRNKNTFLDDYYVGDADNVALCGPLLMVYDAAGDTFSNSQQYLPERFLRPIEESRTPQKIITWGAGLHLCPGRDFAKYEIRMAIAMITTNFKIFDLSKHILPEKQYFSAAAFSARDVAVELSPIDEEEAYAAGQGSSAPLVHKIKDADRVVTVQYLEQGGWLLRNYLDRDQQISFYNYTVDLSAGTQTQEDIKKASPMKAAPMAYYNQLSTGESNCDRPDRWLDLGEHLWALLLKHKDIINQDGIPMENGEGRYGFDSIGVQLYGARSSQKSHKDEHADWSALVNIGASCEFQFGEETLLLHSGDILLADFSKVEHAILKVLSETAPGWFNSDFDEAVDDTGKVKSFGRCLCSAQIRKVSKPSPDCSYPANDSEQPVNN